MHEYNDIDVYICDINRQDVIWSPSIKLSMAATTVETTKALPDVQVRQIDIMVALFCMGIPPLYCSPNGFDGGE